MKFKNFFLSCSTSGGRSRKVEEKQQKYGGLRPGSPPLPIGIPPPPVTTVHPPVSVDLRQEYYNHNGHSHGHATKKHLTNSYSSYSCGSASSSSSSKSGVGGCNGNGDSYSNPNSISKNKRMLDSRSGRHRSERQKGGGGSGSLSSGSNKCTSRQCCIDKEFQQKFPPEFDVSPTPPDDLGVKVGNRVVWLRESPYTNEAGAVKWIGIIEGEEIAGIEFDHQLGLGSGWYKNRQLFTCLPQHGGLVAVAGLILEEDYFFNPDISSSSSSPLSEQPQRLNKSAGGGSAGQSSPSPSPSSSSSTSLEIVPGGYHSVTETQTRLTDFSHNLRPETETRFLPVKTSHPEGAQGDFDWASVPRFPEYHLPVVDCGDAPPSVSPSLSFSSVKPSAKASDRDTSISTSTNNNMPIPFLAAPLREEDTERINGRQKGIQGHRNSCYLDATLFSMFSFSGVFDSFLLQDYRFHNRKEEADEDLARNVQRILRDDIVNPLRKDLYCNAKNVMKLRETMQHLDDKLTSEEMDPQEFLHLLFDKVLNLDEFMSLSSGQSDFFHQVLVQQTDEDRNKIPSIQQLFEQSLMMQDLKLKSVPQPGLMLQMPRSGNKYKTYEGILPNLTIDITDLLEDIPRMCIICGSLATKECPLCYGKFSSGGEARDYSSTGTPAGSGAESTAFCETCLNQTHKRKDRASHLTSVVPIKYTFAASQYFPNANTTTPTSTSTANKSSYYFGQSQIGNWGNPSFNRNPNSTPLISSIPPPSPNSNFNPYPNRSIPRVTMDLFAVICIETSHFVSFVKCGPDRKSPWVFFDSMADRVENPNGTGHNIPQVKLLPQMGVWIEALEKNPGNVKKMMDSETIPAELKRLLADSYMCLYYSRESSMYS